MSMREKFILASILSLSTAPLIAQQKPETIEAPFIQDGVKREPVIVEEKKPQNLAGYWKSKFSSSRFVIAATVSDVEYGQTLNRDKSLTPVTYITFEKPDFLKGSSRLKSFTLAFPGGPIEDTNHEEWLSASGVPLITKGDSVVMFLDKNGNELNPFDDSSYLHVHNGLLFTKEANEILGDGKGNIFLGNNQKIDKILDRHLSEKVTVRIDADQLTGLDIKGLKGLDIRAFKAILGEGKPSKEIFNSSTVGSFSRSEYFASDIDPNMR